MTVKVANEIGATSFLSHSLDGREQQLSSTNTAISDIVSGPKAIVVGTGSSNLKSGFGFKAIEYTTGVTVNSGSELRLLAQGATLMTILFETEVFQGALLLPEL